MTNGENNKTNDLLKNTVTSGGKSMTTDQGLHINDDANTLKAGERGASLLEDFILREKITHFDHERIPERIVHARCSGAHGYFELYEDMSAYTRAKIFTDTANRTPVFVRFSTVAGNKGSGDLARDIRGFAVKFYTQEGIFDLVGNNTPVFFIQDAMKFDGVALQKMKMYLEELKHVQFQLIAPHGGTVRCADNIEHLVDAALMTTESVLFDALYIPGGVNSIAALTREGKVFKFINEALKHCKVIAFDGEAEELFQLSAAKDFVGDEAILLNESPEQFAGALAKHRNWLREPNTLHIAV